MTYTSPTTGDPVGLSFLAPKSAGGPGTSSHHDVQLAHASYGMMGRTPIS